MAKKSEKPKPQASAEDDHKRSLIIGVVAGVLLLAGLCFLGMGIFQSWRNENTDRTQEQNQIEGTKESGNSGGRISAISTEGETAEPVGEPAGESTVEFTPLVAISDLEGKYKATNTSYRRGNTYRPGSITGSSYIVKKGDTLWQIAQGRYGSGYAWVEINKANGGFPALKNGKPVNIPVGYELKFP